MKRFEPKERKKPNAFYCTQNRERGRERKQDEKIVILRATFSFFDISFRSLFFVCTKFFYNRKKLSKMRMINAWKLNFHNLIFFPSSKLLSIEIFCQFYSLILFIVASFFYILFLFLLCYSDWDFARTIWKRNRIHEWRSIFILHTNSGLSWYTLSTSGNRKLKLNIEKKLKKWIGQKTHQFLIQYSIWSMRREMQRTTVCFELSEKKM